MSKKQNKHECTLSKEFPGPVRNRHFKTLLGQHRDDLATNRYDSDESQEPGPPSWKPDCTVPRGRGQICWVHLPWCTHHGINLLFSSSFSIVLSVQDSVSHPSINHNIHPRKWPSNADRYHLLLQPQWLVNHGWSNMLLAQQGTEHAIQEFPYSRWGCSSLKVV